MPRIIIHVNAPEQQKDGELLNLELPEGMTLKDLKGIVESDTGFPAQSQQFYLNGRPLSDELQTLEAAGIKDNEMLAMLIPQPNTNTQTERRQQGGNAGRNDLSADQVETVRLQILGNPQVLQELRAKNPALADSVNDRVRFKQVWDQQKGEEAARERERQNQIALLNEDPFNVDAQRKIEEMIRQDRVMENLQHAYENNPEVFGRVSMLYIDAEVNGRPIKAFVDSGAQVTIMSPSCAEACGIMRLIDTRYSGIAKGVGTARILGRVHHAEITIGGASMACAFTVMEGKDVDLLFGLDMLKRYKAKIDLEKNALCFSGIEVPFLGEAEIPKQHEEALLQEPTVAGPNGTEIGTESGAIQPAGTAAGVGGAAKAQNANFRGQGQVLGSASGSGQSSHPPQASQSVQQEPGSFPQKDIDQLVSLGFSKDEAIRALQATGGNVELAAGLLFG